MAWKSAAFRGRLTFIVLIFFLVSLKGRLGADERPPDEALNLVFISLTNLRADHLGAYGYARETSPAIDALAREGLLFENFFSHGSWTLPVAVSLFTSQYPFTHGLMNRDQFTPLPESAATLMEALEEKGYLTAAFVGDRDYGREFGHTSRFDELHDAVHDRKLDDWKRYGVLESAVPPAISWLHRNRNRKFFLFIQGYDLHCPFAVPTRNDMFDGDYRGEIDFTRCHWTFRKTSPLRIKSEEGGFQEVYLLKTKPEKGNEYEVMFYPDDVRHMAALYDGEIRSADGWVGKLLLELKRLDLEKNTLVVLFSEHGDMLGKHGRFMRGGPLRGTFYDDVLHVPLIIRHPRLAPRRIDGLAQVIDVAPTLLDLLGMQSPPSFRGQSLVPQILGRAPVNRYVYAGSAYTPGKQNAFFRQNSIILSVRSREWKLIVENLFQGEEKQKSLELYDLKHDPEELKDVGSLNPGVMKELEGALEAWLKGISATEVLSELAR